MKCMHVLIRPLRSTGGSANHVGGAARGLCVARGGARAGGCRAHDRFFCHDRPIETKRFPILNHDV
jgi:hypothetical protein